MASLLRSHSLKYALAGLLSVVLAACSVHPLPEDVSGVPTTDIVRSIRCETLAGIDSLSLEERSKAEIAINETMVGYYFEFAGTENNGLSSDVTATSLLNLANDKGVNATFNGSAALSRTSRRQFMIIEPLTDMQTEKNRATCSDRTPRQNWTYPITGTIGVDEIARTYLRLELLTKLKEIKQPINTEKAFDGEPVVLSDDLQFTTHFDATVAGSMEVDAVVGRLRVVSANASAGSSRHDFHRVVVAMTRTAPATPKRDRRDDTQERLILLAEDSVRDPRTQALLMQKDETARTRIAIELYLRRSLRDLDHLPARVLGNRLLDVLKLP